MPGAWKRVSRAPHCACAVEDAKAPIESAKRWRRGKRMGRASGGTVPFRMELAARAADRPSGRPRDSIEEREGPHRRITIPLETFRLARARIDPLESAHQRIRRPLEMLRAIASAALRHGVLGSRHETRRPRTPR